MLICSFFQWLMLEIYFLIVLQFDVSHLDRLSTLSEANPPEPSLKNLLSRSLSLPHKTITKHL